MTPFTQLARVNRALPVPLPVLPEKYKPFRGVIRLPHDSGRFSSQAGVVVS